ncbi:RNA polymerase II transcription factor B subunit 2 [Dimargaris cristalligena]|uniref:RNA polymerase II transcription factor B subunit 2 n=1 Tax=Dimargaris cristalligena TaxID=215637 RepID=A0A4P9ZQT8_9FUNG|nr:RNA polymerase II transcription factor B subunit 2 [Dimargaris cristalligena]|eukprot:RKP35685.1 RNA polymerase II transcription factor B subunit 2 [Dimargaris cristalligena]
MATATSFKASIYAYLDSLPTQTFQRLFSNPATCLVILRLLSTLSKQIIMALLYVDHSVPTTDIDQWFRREYASVARASLQELMKLHILTEEAVSTSASSTSQQRLLVMNSVFREQLRNALTGGGQHQSFGVPCLSRDKHQVDVAFLDRYATDKWESILHFLVGTSATDMPGPGVLGLLQQSGLMQQQSATGGGGEPGKLTITNNGFQFLLQDVSTQVWMFLLQYLDLAEKLQMDLVEVLHFLFQLGSLELGADYSTDSLTPTQLQMLEDLRDYGIVYQRKKRSRRFYPTRLATTLTTGLHNITPSFGQAGAAGGGGEASQDVGFIVLETNYRLYAYTDSPLQIAILNLFVSLKSRFANMVVGVITRDSMRSALAHGITADQIIVYLTTHAHVHMRDRNPVLPITVTDQLRLWEMEKNRIRPQNGYLYNKFTRPSDYAVVCKYARELGVVEWYSDKSYSFVVTPEGHQTVKAFLTRRLQRQSSDVQQPSHPA